VGDLSRTHGLAGQPRRASQLAAVEPVAARECLQSHLVQVRVDGGNRVDAPPKAFELGVVAVALDRTAKNGARAALHAKARPTPPRRDASDAGTRASSRVERTTGVREQDRSS
jgi:hypothetical protein